MLYLNGKIISDSDARIDPSDRGFLLGDGLFETIRCAKGKPIDLEAHWKRLTTGADYLQLIIPLSLDETQHVITKLLDTNSLTENAGARITVTRGPGARGLSIPQPGSPTILITVFARQNNTHPISLSSSDICINEQSPLTKFKTLNYLDKIIARQHAQNNHFDDALLLNTKGRIVSTTTANLFFVKDNTLHTPALAEGPLPGITRDHILSLAKKQKISVEEGAYTIDDVLTAEGVFTSNSLIGLCLVSRLDQTSFPSSSRYSSLIKLLHHSLFN